MNNYRIKYFLLITYTLTSVLALPFLFVMVAATLMPGYTAWLKLPFAALLPVLLVGANWLAWSGLRRNKFELFYLTLLFPLLYAAILFTVIDLY